jgi:hypothetical protein
MRGRNFDHDKLPRQIAPENGPPIIPNGLKGDRPMSLEYSRLACCISLNNQINFRINATDQLSV